MIIAAAVRELIAAGVTGEALVESIARMEAEIPSRSSSGAERTRRWRERKASQNVTVTSQASQASQASQTVTNRHGDVTASPPSPPSSPPSMVSLNNPSLTTPSSSPSSPEALASLAWSFDEFWRLYPHKIGKKDALKAFDVAKRSEIPFEVVAEALQRYIREKPPDRPYCNPATWLRQGRWDDQPAPQTNGNGNGQVENPNSVVAAGQRLLDRIRSWDDPVEGNSTGS